MLELVQPFLFFILPIVLILVWMGLNNLEKQYCFIFFLLPIIALSGMWHAQLLVNHRQVAVSNNIGFDLVKTWSSVTYERLEGDEPIIMPPGTERHPHLNTRQHSRNNKNLVNSVLRYWIESPGKSLVFAQEKIFKILSSGLDLGHVAPLIAFQPIYNTILWILALVSSLVCMSAIYKTTFNYRYSSVLISSPFFILAFMSLYFMLMGAITTKSEHARVLISILPLLILVFGSIIPIKKTDTKSYYKSIV